MSQTQRYLILPARGLTATAQGASKAARDFFIELATGGKPMRAQLSSTLAASVRACAAKRPKVRLKSPAGFELIESLHEDGIKLVTTTAEMVAALRFEQPGVRLVPERTYKPAVYRPALIAPSPKAAAAGIGLVRRLQISVVDGGTGQGLGGVAIVAFTDFAAREGVSATTGATGSATLTVTGKKTYERLYVQHELPGLWSYLGYDVAARGSLTIRLQPVDLGTGDSLRHFHAAANLSDGTGVKVGVIDSGVALHHADLRVSGGLGCVPGEPETDYGPSGGPHGTHVAGIIAGRGSSPTGMRGLAPDAQLYSYRVFGSGPSSGGSFAIAKAIDRALQDGCDLLNLSLSFDRKDFSGPAPVDETVREAIAEAHAKGVVVIAAAGNDGRKTVSYPAADDLALAVSAVGHKGTFPSGSSETGDVMGPSGADPRDFVAAFSNVGTELDVAGAGVGVVSTVPGGYAPMSGTSMAAPAVTGATARLLAQRPAVLNAARDRNRADAIRGMVFAMATSLGLGLTFEGKGLLR